MYGGSVSTKSTELFATLLRKYDNPSICLNSWLPHLFTVDIAGDIVGGSIAADIAGDIEDIEDIFGQDMEGN